MNDFESLRQRYRKFYKDKEGAADDGLQLLFDLRIAGRYVDYFDDERDWLGIMARDVANRIFEMTGEYHRALLERPFLSEGE